MKSIYKKELYSLLFTSTAGVFTFFILLFSGIFFTVFNIIEGSGNFSETINMISYIILLSIPIMTMSAYPKDREGGGDFIILTTHLSPIKIAFAKYYALLTVFLIPFTVIAIYPFFLWANGGGDIANSLCAVLGLLLFSSFLISLGVFISSISPSKQFAASLTYAVFLVLYLYGTLQLVIPTDRFSNYFISFAVVLVFGIMGYCYCHHAKFSITVTCSILLILTIIYFENGDLYYNLLYNLLSLTSISRGFYTFSQGIFSLESLFFYLGFSIVLVVLSAILPSHTGTSPKYLPKHHKKAVKHANLKVSVFYFSLSILIILSVFTIHLTVFSLPADLTCFDTTSNRYHSFSSGGEKYLSSIDKQTTIYLVSNGTQVDTELEMWLKKSASSSPSISVITIDSKLYPDFTKKFTEDALSDNSIIVSSHKGASVIRYEDLFLYGLTFMNNQIADEINYDSVIYTKNAYIEAYRNDYGIDISSYIAYFPTHYVRENVLLSSIEECCGIEIKSWWLDEIKPISIAPPEPNLSDAKTLVSSIVFSVVLPLLFPLISFLVIHSRKRPEIETNCRLVTPTSPPVYYGSSFNTKKAFSPSKKTVMASVSCILSIFILILLLQNPITSNRGFGGVSQEFIDAYIEADDNNYSYSIISTITPADIIKFSFHYNSKEYIFTKNTDGGWSCNQDNTITDALSVSYSLNKMGDIKIYISEKFPVMEATQDNLEKCGLSDGFKVSLTFKDNSIVEFAVGDYLNFGSAHYFTLGDGKIYVVLNRFTSSLTDLCN